MLMRANTLAKGYSGTRVEVVELLLECLERGTCPEVPSRGSVGASGDLAPLAHLALPLVGEGRAPGSRASCSPAPTRSPGPGSSRSARRPRKGSRSSTARSSWRAFAALGVVRARAPGEDGRRRVCADRRRAPGLARQLPAAHPRAASARRPGRVRREHPRARSRARRSSRRTAGATRCRTRTRCAARPQVHGASRDLLGVRRADGRRASSTPRPTTRSCFVDGRHGRLERQLPRAAARVRARRAGDGASASWRASPSGRTERLVNPALSDGLPAFLAPDGGLNSGFMIPQYVAASLVSENKVALPSRERRLDPDERRPGGSRVDGQRRGAEGLAGARERGARRWRSSFSPARRRSSSTLRSRPESVRARRTSSSARSRRGCATTVRSPTTSRRWRRRSATARALAAVEAEAGELG